MTKVSSNSSYSRKKAKLGRGTSSNAAWRLIYKTIKEEILVGVYPPGNHLPSYRNLSIHFNVSINTIQKAIEALQKEKFVEMQQGVGVFVCKRKRAKKSQMKIGLIMRDPFDNKNESDLNSSTGLLYKSLLNTLKNNSCKLELIKPLEGRLQYYENIFPDDILTRGFDGLITFGPMRPDYLLQLKIIGIPVVCIDGDGLSIGFDSVLTDDVVDSAELVQYLIELGHKRIALVNRPLPGGRRNREYDSSTHLRLDGIRTSMILSKLPFSDKQVFYRPVKDVDVHSAFLKFYNKQKPTAIIFYSGSYIWDFDKNLKEIDIPREVSAVSYGWAPLKSAQSKRKLKLTGIFYSLEECGNKAAQQIVSRINNPLASLERIVIKGKLIKGNSALSIS